MCHACGARLFAEAWRSLERYTRYSQRKPGLRRRDEHFAIAIPHGLLGSVSPCTVELHGLSVDRFREISGVTVTASPATFELSGLGGNLVWGTRNETALVSGYATLDLWRHGIQPAEAPPGQIGSRGQLDAADGDFAPVRSSSSRTRPSFAGRGGPAAEEFLDRLAVQMSRVLAP